MCPWRRESTSVNRLQVRPENRRQRSDSDHNVPRSPLHPFFFERSRPKSQDGQQNIHLTHAVSIANINNLFSKRPSFSKRKKQTNTQKSLSAPNASNSRSLLLLQEQLQSLERGKEKFEGKPVW